MDDLKNLLAAKISHIALTAAILFAGTLFLLAAAGISDPKPLGRLAAHEERVTLTADHATAFHLAPITIATPGTLKATLMLSRGTDASAVGLAWGDEEVLSAVLVTSSGHLGIYAFEDGIESAVQPFERYPHVTGGENTLQVNFSGTAAIIWLNEEYVTTLACDASEGLAIGVVLWAPEEEATMEVRMLEVWQ